MDEWLGIEHLFELSASEAIWGFLTPLFVFIAFFVVQLILPGRRVPGYVVDSETGEPRSYRLNGILVFAVAMIVWVFEIGGLPRDWFYRSSAYAVAGGTVLAIIMTSIAVFSQPEGKVKNPFLAWWFGRAQEIQLFNGRFDVKMYLYVVGGTMLSLNCLSGAVWHYRQFGDDANPGVYLYAGFFTFYVLDYFVFERVQLYTYDLIHENVGFKMLWGGTGGLRVALHPAAVGSGCSPRSGILGLRPVGLAHRYAVDVLLRVVHLAWRQHAEVHVQALAGA